jgi:hypothetical protein
MWLDAHAKKAYSGATTAWPSAQAVVGGRLADIRVMEALSAIAMMSQSMVELRRMLAWWPRPRFHLHIGGIPIDPAG